MDSQEKTGLRHAQDVSEFLESLRALKEASGLTLRQLEERAAAAGDYLPRSTLSSMLSGRRLPRPELLAAFVRACGHERRLTDWLRLRDQLAQRDTRADAARADTAGSAAADSASVDSTAVSADAPRRGAARRFLRARLLVPLAVAVLLAAAAAVAGTRDEPGGGKPPPGAAAATDASGKAADDSGTGAASTAADVPRGAVRLRPLSAPRLCLTDGLVRDRRYAPLVAVQRPCTRTRPQTTELRAEPGSGRYRIQWHHPEFGTGCLKVLGTGAGKGLLEPWDACDQAELFRLVPVRGRNTYALRTDAGRCVGIARPVTAEGTEAVEQRCTAARNQMFRIESAPTDVRHRPDRSSLTPRG
ncbi:helix-turn-helix domain-containing protein [Streptomyces spirodelae]|uniref:Helix-turn-helix transcriptional regulator n=1 Tax=Streptomyces spirodelae TaxID=2812904 RepID=A0ABS3WM42_9ACTN|nr:helix-turn-helix transcriptional regulator [Streptomyces spirodelae]MBO8184185.1 helix-turn-helix transcriptional regulator [Streptomyces spirodelae]